KNGSTDEKAKPEGRGKGSGIIFYIALFSLLVAPGLTRAQERNPQQRALPQAAPADTMRLTLDQAVTLALRQNTTAQVAMITAAESTQDKNIARAALLPQVDLNVSDSVQRINLEAFLGQRIAGFPQHAGPFQVFQAGPNFGMPIFDLTLYRRY